MDFRPSEQQRWAPAGEEHFTGRVWFGPLAEPKHDDDLNVLGVMFEPSARTDWHTHPGGQALFIVSGNGRVQRDDGETVRVGPGDTVYAPPGERHWHGATEDSFMVHLSITAGGPTAWEAEKVSDADYARNR